MELIAQRAARNPVIPSNAEDRTGTAGILRRARAAIRARFAGMRPQILAIFDAIPTYEVNDDKVRPGAIVRYGMTQQQMAQTMADLQAVLDRWLLEGKDVDRLAWWDSYPQEAAQLGAAQSVANLSRLSDAYAATRTLQSVIFSESYIARAGLARSRSSEYWTGLVAQQRTTLANIIGRAVVDGVNPNVARAEIAEALEVSKSRALLYAQTEITGTLREARWAEADDATESLNLNIGLLWTSAFLKTTRSWHASRHGQVYSSKEVRDFYGQRGNRYRCHCAQTEALLDENDEPILTDRLQASMAQEKRNWQAANDDE